MQKTARQLFPERETEQAAWCQALLTPRPYAPALIWRQPRPAPVPFALAERPAWLPAVVDVVQPDQRPGQHALHEAGAYYCLDPSSVFAATVLDGLVDAPGFVVDLCAAPGGKSVAASTLLRPQFLVANEVIGKRTGALVANLERCGVKPAAVVSADVSVLARAWPKAADVVLVDAPCSGQSLLARGIEAPGCFHPATVNLNANRQRRILAHAAEIVAPGGWLAYMTCTFAPKENEGNVAWFLKHQPAFRAVEVARLAPHRSTLSEAPSYRLWPHRDAGAGAFVTLFEREKSGPHGEFSPETIPAGIRVCRQWR